MSDPEETPAADSSEATETADTGWPELSFEETRVLGCLIEKERTTPDHYPLTLNSLHSACNQSSNRDPVVDFGTDTVEEAIEGLRYRQLALQVHQAGARVPKCKHTLENLLPYINKAQTAILCVLLLRGFQTAGELRQRTERMHVFADVDAVQTTLEEMIEFTPHPLVALIPAGGGRRVATYGHLLSGAIDLATSTTPSANSPAVPSVGAPSWRADMEEELAELRESVTALKTELDELKQNLGV
ncbi:MAG: YceH family protein [Verrucomicrobiota bacterium]